MSKNLDDFGRYTVTSALPYANGPLHLGHLAGAYLPADIYVRYLRSRGKKVLYVCGTDEHGAAISIQAKKEGIHPKEVVDKYYGIIKKAFDDFGISFDVFSRTSKQIHHDTATEFFLKFYNEGKFEEKTTKQLYDEKAGMFLADRYVTGTCPKCNHPSAYGDQCENCGSSLNALDLIDPKSTLSETKPIVKETTHWFLPLDQYEERLKKYILEDKTYWKPNVYGQCKSWLTEGLQARAISRDLDWGVKIPVPGGENKVLYVWFDAPIGYISATKEWAAIQNEAGVQEDWKDWWAEGKDTALIHFIGKDNIVFHCLIFPSILMGHGGYLLPENVPANEFLNLEGKKLSTSRNWAVWLHKYLEDFPGKADIMRYVLTATMPENKDNDFTWKDFQARNNNELAAILGNFVRRGTVLTNKYYEGVVPEVVFSEEDEKVFEQVHSSVRNIEKSLESYRFREAATHMMEVARIGNKYLQDSSPWHLIKTEPEKVKSIIYLCLNICGVLAVVMEPFMPQSAQKLREDLNLPELKWDDAFKKDLVPTGHKINQPGILFEKIEDSQIEDQLEKLKMSENDENIPDWIPAPKEECTYEDFQKMDIRVGEILSAERVPKTEKLLKLLVDVGFDQKTIVSGISEHFEVDKLIGKKATVLVNLKARKIRGVLSQGMLLFAEDENGKLFSLENTQNVQNGATIN